MSKITHEQVWAASRALRPLPTDYKDYGGEVERWADDNTSYPDCSGGCPFYAALRGDIGADWGVCTQPGNPRQGLLTFEHQAGFGCFPEKT